MVNKCSAPGCKSGYKENDFKGTLFSFPTHQPLLNEWIDAAPKNISVQIHATSQYAVPFREALRKLKVQMFYFTPLFHFAPTHLMYSLFNREFLRTKSKYLLFYFITMKNKLSWKYRKNFFH